MSPRNEREANRALAASAPDRTDYVSDAGRASWWKKDGAWHIAIRETGRDGVRHLAAQNDMVSRVTSPPRLSVAVALGPV